MLQKIALDTINKYKLIEKNDFIVVGVSGGADSISLLHFLNSIKDMYNLKIIAVHINHCMRGEESDQDSEFVVNFCNSIGIPCRVFSYDIYKKAKEENMSLEQAGRKYRYDSFYTVLNEVKANKIAIAHNKDDNAETIIMRFFRGTGLKGLTGIPYKRDIIIRPLLDCLRSDIEDYCVKNNINYRNDSTNSMDIYTRNKIRLNVIPYIKKEFNSNIVDSLSNMAKNFSEENMFLDSMAKRELDSCILEKTDAKIVLDTEKLSKLDDVIKKRIFRLCLAYFNTDLYNLYYEHINMIINILKKQTGKQINLPNNINVYKQYNKLIINKGIKLNEKVEYSYKLDLEKTIFIKEIGKFILLSKNIINISTKVYTISLNYDKIKNRLSIRQRNVGDKIYINNMTKKIKNIFIDSKIPSQDRDFYPILLCDDNIIGIIGICLVNEYKPTNEENTVYLHIWEENTL